MAIMVQHVDPVSGESAGCGVSLSVVSHLEGLVQRCRSMWAQVGTPEVHSFASAHDSCCVLIRSEILSRHPCLAMLGVRSRRADGPERRTRS